MTLKKGMLIKLEEHIYRVLAVKEESVLLIDCQTISARQKSSAVRELRNTI